MLDTDEKTFEKLFREHYSLLCNYANSIVCNEQAVEDIVQNFFIAVWEKKHLSITEDTFLPYAYRAIKNSSTTISQRLPKRIFSLCWRRNGNYNCKKKRSSDINRRYMPLFRSYRKNAGRYFC